MRTTRLLIASAMLACAAIVIAADTEGDDEPEEHQKQAAKAEKCKCLWDAEDAKISNTCGLEAHQECTREMIGLERDITESGETVSQSQQAKDRAKEAVEAKKTELANKRSELEEKIRITQEKRETAETEKQNLLKKHEEFVAAQNAKFDPLIASALKSRDEAKAEMDRLNGLMKQAQDDYQMAVACNNNNNAPVKSAVDPSKKIVCKDCGNDPKCAACEPNGKECTQEAATKLCRYKISKHDCVKDVCVTNPDPKETELSGALKQACVSVCTDPKQAAVSEYKSLCEKCNKAAGSACKAEAAPAQGSH